MRRFISRGACLIGLVLLLAGCRTTSPGYQDWHDEAGFRVEATSRTFPASIESVCLAVTRAAETSKLKSSCLEIAAKLPDSEDKTADKPGETTKEKAKRVAVYDNKSIVKSPLGHIQLELDKEGIKVDLDALTVHHARLVGMTAEGRPVQVRIDPSPESGGALVAARVGTGQRLDGAASQALVERVAEALRTAPSSLTPKQREDLFEDAAVFFDKKTDGDYTSVRMRFSLPLAKFLRHEPETDAKSGSDAAAAR